MGKKWKKLWLLEKRAQASAPVAAEEQREQCGEYRQRESGVGPVVERPGQDLPVE